MISGVARACFGADAKRKVAANHPDDALDKSERREDVVGVLRKPPPRATPWGATVNIQNEVKKMMVKVGFIQSGYDASLYYNPAAGVMAMVRGGDFVAVGERDGI